MPQIKFCGATGARRKPGWNLFAGAKLALELGMEQREKGDEEKWEGELGISSR